MSDFKAKSISKYDRIIEKNKAKSNTIEPRMQSFNLNEVVSYSVGRVVQPKYRKRNIKASIKLNNG